MRLNIKQQSVQIFQMLNTKVISRKRSEQLLPSKQLTQSKTIKRKKSASNLHPSKIKKQVEKQFKNGHQKILVHSHSKGKLKPTKTKNDQNINNMNFRKSLEKTVHGKSHKDVHLVSETSKQKQKQKNTHKTCSSTNLTKSKSLSKLRVPKKTTTKRQQGIKESSQVKIRRPIKSTLQTERIQLQTKISISKNEQPKKTSTHFVTKTKTKKSNVQVSKNSSKIKLKKNKISQIIQKSILYSDVNYDFKQQISFLGSGIKEQEQVFLPYPFQSPNIMQQSPNIMQQTNQQIQQRQRRNNAAIMIQKNFKGYIQRKYIIEAQYIIRCIKTIQRSWRKYRQRKQGQVKCMEKNVYGGSPSKLSSHERQRQLMNRIGQASTSLITIKDLNDTLVNRSDNKKTLISEINTFRGDSKETTLNATNKMNLKEIIRNLLEEDGLNENIKEKIRNAMGSSESIAHIQKDVGHQSDNHQQEESQASRQKNANMHRQQSPLSQNGRSDQDSHSLSDLSEVKHSQSHLQENDQIILAKKMNSEDKAAQNTRTLGLPNQNDTQQDQQNEADQFDKSRDDYVQRKITMEIESENKFFKSPMRESPMNHKMLSPAVGSLTSPKCLNSSITKDLKSKNNYNQYFKSSKASSAVFKSPLKSPCVSAQKSADEQLNNGDSSPRLFRDLEEKLDKENNPNSQNLSEDRDSCRKQIFKLQKQDYMKSPQRKLSEDSESQNKGIDYFQAIYPHQRQEEQKVHQTDMLGFVTTFPFIEEFCLIITDYIREDDSTIEVFVQKLHSLKYYKIQQVLQEEWKNIQFDDLEYSNKHLEEMLMKTHQSPSVFSRSEKKMIKEYDSLRIFLHNNQYSDSEIYASGEENPQSAYIRFVFDIFEESVCENFAQCTLKNLPLFKQRQSGGNFEYMSKILCNALGNILKCAEMQCGRLQSEDMTEEQKDENKLINEIRIDEMIVDEHSLQTEPLEMLIRLKLGEGVFEDLMAEVIRECLI